MRRSKKDPPADQNLQQKRVRIDQIDAGILALLHERMKLAIEISRIKKDTGKAIEDLDREEDLLAKLLEKNVDKDLIPDEEILLIWGKIIELSRRIQGNEPVW